MRKRTARSLAAAALARAFPLNPSIAFLTDAGAPASRSRLGGGRKRSMSAMRVTRENITYKFSHQASSLAPLGPWGDMRAQSMVTPVRSVCPWEALAVR